MSDCYDYLVIGAGPAGCIVAGELKKAGYAVGVLEKHNEDYRKICGDGVASVTITTLRKIGFPIDYFDKFKALKIHRFIILREDEKGNTSYMEEIQEEKGKLVYGLARNNTDGLFRRYLTKDIGVEVFYNNPVTNIVSLSNSIDTPMYDVNGYLTRRVIIAAGSSARILLNGKIIVSPNPSNPVGVSAILRAENVKDPYFLFDYKKHYNGTYGWLFCVGDNEYNAGLWLKTDKNTINKEFNMFLNSRVKEYLGPDYDVIRKPMGVIMGIGERRTHYSDSIFIIGDSANTSNPVDGEGISRAISDALDFVDSIKKGIVD